MGYTNQLAVWLKNRCNVLCVPNPHNEWARLHSDRQFRSQLVEVVAEAVLLAHGRASFDAFVKRLAKIISSKDLLQIPCSYYKQKLQ